MNKSVKGTQTEKNLLAVGNSMNLYESSSTGAFNIKKRNSWERGVS
jgi:hypothetical protein